MGALLATAALLGWGSWQAPNLSSYARAAEFVVLDAPRLQPGADSARLQARVTALPGITACAIRPAKQLLVVAYNPDSLSQAQLCQRLGLSAQAPPLPSPAARQCPVPAGYVLALEKVRFALNLRRLFTHL
ncbi:MAG: hypothetical protein ACRYFK_19745 [Janthinobacterium lividum]